MLPASHGSDEGEGHQTAISLPLRSQEIQQGHKLAIGRLPSQSRTPTPVLLSPSASARSSVDLSRSRDGRSPALTTLLYDNNNVRDVILKSFQAKIAVYASADTEELVRLKGIYGGFCGLLKPFGENIQGKVVIRDSVGASKSWSDFAVKFVEFGQGNVPNVFPPVSNGPIETSQSRYRGSGAEGPASNTSSSTQLLELSCIDQVLERFVSIPTTAHEDSPNGDSGSGSKTPAYYVLYLRKLLSDRPMLPYQPSSQPVACIIAISSQSPNPIERLRELYSDTRQIDQKLPVWLGDEVLRYYVLVHDEDHDDITRSTALFDQMKRHFGLHCHLLRLRSIECGPSDEDGTAMPACEWLSAAEDLEDIQRKGQDVGIDEYQQYLYDTDVAVLRTFVREMVTQSILPFMENRVTVWNDQVASRRRGISGRFLSLSKRWAGFGSGRASKPSPSSTTSSPGSNYNTSLGFYSHDSPEAVMHRLADYAFMLRDWKLSSSIYDILRTDFDDDKAWRHHAVANEMAASSLLLAAQTSTTRLKAETINPILDAASYSYITRCADPQGAVRCLTIAVELYRSCGGAAAEEAAKWADRLLELSILSPLAQCILTERLANCYESMSGIGLEHWGSRLRKTAFWKFMTSQAWLLLRKHNLAKSRLAESAMSYGITARGTGLPGFAGMQRVWDEINMDLDTSGPIYSYTETGLFNTGESDELGDEREDLDLHFAARRRISSPLLETQSPGIEAINLLQRLNNPLDQADDGFV